MTEVLTAFAIPLGAILSILMEIVKVYPVPARVIHAILLAAAFILAFICKYNAGWYEILISWIITFSTSIASYELVLKNHDEKSGN